jgi:signal transduction histidine kinase
MLQCLIQANLKLQEYDQDRTNFLTRAVHDFRAPLTAVSGRIVVFNAGGEDGGSDDLALACGDNAAQRQQRDRPGQLHADE